MHGGFGSPFDHYHLGSLYDSSDVDTVRKGAAKASKFNAKQAGLRLINMDMNRLGIVLSSAESPNKISFYINLSEHQLWTRYRTSKGTTKSGYLVQLQVLPPEKESPTISTSYNVIRALQLGTISADKALDTGVLVVINDPGKDVVALLKNAFPAKDKSAQKVAAKITE
ncbi:hypothetical protein GCM10025776_09680 [Corallincola platygyrae]